MNAREIAYTCLKEICINKKYSNLLLRKELDHADRKDRALITQIVYGTLQNYRYVRYQWESYVKLAPREEISILLDMSVYQLLCMDHVPEYATINEAVNIAKKDVSVKYGNLVNAVLHRVIRQKERKITGSKEHILAIQTSHPDWVVMMWKAQYGYEIAEKICRSNIKAKGMVVRVNTLKTTKEELLKHADFKEAKIAKDALYYTGTSLTHTSYYRDGLVSIQDESSQLVSYMVNPQKGERILDVCSAPGTKACHMAQLMENEGEIICGDIHEHRVELIAQGAKRLGITILKPQVLDATKLDDFEEKSFDRVLCDVPCSGYGVLGSKSDIKYHMKSEDMDSLIPLQQQILKRSAQMVKEEGILVYSTCTLNKKENEKQIETFLKKEPSFTCLRQETIFPFTYQSDGFFMALLKRTKEK